MGYPVWGFRIEEKSPDFRSPEVGISAFPIIFLPEGCAELITDPLKVFDSFSVFVEPISYQRIFHLVSVFLTCT